MSNASKTKNERGYLAQWINPTTPHSWKVKLSPVAKDDVNERFVWSTILIKAIQKRHLTRTKKKKKDPNNRSLAI